MPTVMAGHGYFKQLVKRNINYLVKNRNRNKFVMGIKCAFPSFSTTLSQKSFASTLLRVLSHSVPGVSSISYNSLSL
jgi:hypothetical protein